MKKAIILLLLFMTSCVAVSPEKRCYYAKLDVESMVLTEREGETMLAVVRCSKHTD